MGQGLENNTRYDNTRYEGISAPFPVHHGVLHSSRRIQSTPNSCQVVGVMSDGSAWKSSRASNTSENRPAADVEMFWQDEYTTPYTTFLYGWLAFGGAKLAALEEGVGWHGIARLVRGVLQSKAATCLGSCGGTHHTHYCR